MTAVTMPSATLPPISIEVGGPGSAPYKSIDHVRWDSIPPLAVLTGLNGSGKTQLLEILAHKLTNTPHRELGDLKDINVTVTGDTFDSSAVAYIPSRWEFGGAPQMGMAQLQQTKQNLFQQLQWNSIQHDMAKRAVRARLERLLGVKSLDELNQEKFNKVLPDDFSFLLEELDVTSGLIPVFLAYRLRSAEAMEKGIAQADISNELGPAPWDVLNETFEAADFPYRVDSPLGTPMLDNYQLWLEDRGRGVRIRPMDLSSGEKTLLGLVVWLYNSQHHGRFPRLFLLDEPDVYLHPSLTRQFLNVIKDVLVDRYKVRTILTTHSPSTVALAPEDALFEMSKTPPRIKRSTSQPATIGLLTAGLVTVSPGTRFVLAEDDDDVKFYSMVRDLLLDYGPSRDPRAIEPAPSIVFLPASVGSGKGKTGGGVTVVVGWVEKFDEAPLNEIVRGVIDRDIANTGTSRIYPIGRYSIENYQLDPFVVFGALLDAGKAPPLSTVIISAGDEHLLRAMSNAEL